MAEKLFFIICDDKAFDSKTWKEIPDQILVEQ